MSPVNVDEDPLRGKIRILVDPVSEMFTSLHVLADSSHHLSNQDWATATLAAMPADLREEIVYFGRYFDQWLSVADIVQFIDEVGISVPAFFERVATLPPLAIVNVTLGIPAIPEYGNPVQIFAPEIVAVRENAQANPAAFVTRLLSVLRRYWTDFFMAEWEHRYPLLDSRRAL